MQADDVKKLIASSISDADISVTLDGSHAHVNVVSSVFEGMSAVKKQQLVYSGLKDAIAAGTIHAVHIKTFTPAEWQAHQA